MKEDKFYGCYKGFVFDNKDPEFLMRLRVEVPQVYGEESPEIWALPKGIFCGNKIGFVAIPNKEDAVWVSFEGGDPRFPIWEYGWFARGEMPTAANNNNGKPTNTILQTKSGHRIELDDKEGSEVVRITDKFGNIIEMNSNGISQIADKISQGSLNNSAEKAVLGETLKNLLNEFIADLGTLANIPVNPSTFLTAPISAAPTWAAFVLEYQTKWNDFLSNKVTLD